MEKLSPEQREEIRKIVREEIKKPTCKACQLQKLPRLLKKKLKKSLKNLAMNLELFIKFLDLLRLTISKFQPSKTAIIVVDHINVESFIW